jgi:hypothetical protein
MEKGSNQPKSIRSVWPGRVAALAAPVFALLGVVILCLLPPTKTSFYPRCMLHSLTGLNCPGCGATRCLYALLHGDLRQAAAYNVLFLVVLPPFLALAARVWWAALRGRPSPSLPVPPWAIRILLVVLIAFGVLRNINVYPFTLLAPHELGSAGVQGAPPGEDLVPVPPAEQRGDRHGTRPDGA